MISSAHCKNQTAISEILRLTVVHFLNSKSKTETVEQQQGEQMRTDEWQKQEWRQRDKRWVYRGIWHTPKDESSLHSERIGHLAQCVLSGDVVCVSMWVSVCVCHESARGDRSICPVMRPCKLVWSEKPVQICVAALCVSHWISVKVETAGTSHLTAPLFCWWWGKDESSSLLWPLGRPRGISLWCCTPQGHLHSMNEAKVREDAKRLVTSMDHTLQAFIDCEGFFTKYKKCHDFF